MAKGKALPFSVKHLPSLLKETAITWNKVDPWRLSAVIAYYAILSLPGLLVVIITMLSYIYGPAMIEGQIYSEIKATMGASAAESIRSIIENSRGGQSSWIATVVGIGAMIFGATGVFYHLQISINRIWEVKSDPKNGLLRYVIDRSRSFGFVMVIGFLLLVSFVISALLRALQGYIIQWIPEAAYYVLSAAELIISLGVITLLFALIFKYLPDVFIGWKSVWMGAIITSVLFTIGKALLSFYFGEASPGTVYGAAGSLIIILLWVSYSSLIIFFGAVFTWVFTRRYGLKFRLKSHASYLPGSMPDELKHD